MTAKKHWDFVNKWSFNSGDLIEIYLESGRFTYMRTSYWEYWPKIWQLAHLTKSSYVGDSGVLEKI